MNTRHLRPEDLRGKRWRGLIRESTEHQAEQWSPDRQRADLVRAAEELGLVGMDEWYVRVGSGEAEAVPELELALADGLRGEFDVLLVIHTSRFARNRAEAVRMKAQFAKAGLVIYFVAQRIVSGAFASGLAEGINEVIDEHANEERRFWIAGGLRERQLAGLWVGRIPYGYRKVMVDQPDGGRTWGGALEVDPVTGALVAEMVGMSATGTPGRKIALQMNGRGLPSPAGGLWSQRTVQQILTNPVYKGAHIRYGRKTPRHYYPEDDAHDGRREIGTLPAIVTEGLWEDCNRLLHDRSTGGHGRGRRAYPLSRTLRCGVCGWQMTGATGGRSEKRYYRCSKRYSGGGCTAPAISADMVEGAFVEWLGLFHLPPDWREKIARRRDQAADGAETVRRARLAKSLGRLRDLYQWGDLDESEYHDQADAIKAEMGALAKRDQRGLTENVVLALANLGAAWGTRRAPETPKLLLESAVVTDEGFEWRVRSELQPLLEVCGVPTSARLRTCARHCSVRFVA
jgi:DNA invertase Pin-like site-specific DNA recombinase